MTFKLFWQDPYLTRLDTQVTRVDGNDVTVAETIFYAFSGGQESDHGTIAGKPVLKARKEGKEIFYTLEEGHGLEVGEAVTMGSGVTVSCACTSRRNWCWNSLIRT